MILEYVVMKRDVWQFNIIHDYKYIKNDTLDVWWCKWSKGRVCV